MSAPNDPTPDDDADIAALLQQAGSRDMPSMEMMAQVEAAVHAQWRETVAQRRLVRRRIVGWSVAAGVALAGIASLLTMQLTAPTAVPIASIAHIDGQVVASSTGSARPVAIGEHVVGGESLRTTAQSRLALNWPGGMSVRLDHDTNVRIESTDRMLLLAGAVYVDAGPSSSRPLTIESALGSVQHVGTQYEVRARTDGLLISVREGRVEVRHAAGTLSSLAGERVSVHGNGAIERTRISPRDPAWDWTINATPPYQIDNRSLADFLRWMSRETGRKVVFDSPQAQEEATRVILRGSIAGLHPETALSVVLSTTRLSSYQTADDSLGIRLSRD